MSSTFTTNKNLELIGTGDQVGTWGAELNTQNWTTLDQMLGSLPSVALSNVPVNLTTPQIQNLGYIFSGTLTADVTVTFPAVGGFFIVVNSTTGDFKLTLARSGGGSTLIIPRNGIALILVSASFGVTFVNNAAGVFGSIVGAPTTDIGTFPGPWLTVTGTGAAITSFGTAWSDSQPIYYLQFAASGNTIATGSGITTPSGQTVSPLAGDVLVVQKTGPGTSVVLGSLLQTGDTLLNRIPVQTLASAGTVDLSAVSAERLNISGTATISSFGTWTGVKFVTATGAFKLAQAAGLNVPTGTTIQVVAGDTFTLINNGGTTSRVAAYQRSSGQPLATDPTPSSLTTLGAVGSLAFLRVLSGGISPGNSYSSGLAYSGTPEEGAGSPSGTWRAMGFVPSSGATLFIRTA